MTLMLFDEADVLADEDRGFLSTLGGIIQESKVRFASHTTVQRPCSFNAP